MAKTPKRIADTDEIATDTVADGEYLLRSGDAVVGGTPAGTLDSVTVSGGLVLDVTDPANPDITVGAQVGSGITVNALDIEVNESEVDHDTLDNWTAEAHRRMLFGTGGPDTDYPLPDATNAPSGTSYERTVAPFDMYLSNGTTWNPKGNPADDASIALNASDEVELKGFGAATVLYMPRKNAGGTGLDWIAEPTGGGASVSVSAGVWTSHSTAGNGSAVSNDFKINSFTKSAITQIDLAFTPKNGATYGSAGLMRIVPGMLLHLQLASSPDTDSVLLQVDSGNYVTDGTFGVSYLGVDGGSTITASTDYSLTVLGAPLAAIGEEKGTGKGATTAGTNLLTNAIMSSAELDGAGTYMIRFDCDATSGADAQLLTIDISHFNSGFSETVIATRSVYLASTTAPINRLSVAVSAKVAISAADAGISVRGTVDAGADATIENYTCTWERCVA